MKLSEAKQILKKNGYKLILEYNSDYEIPFGVNYMDSYDYAEKYEPMVGDEFDKIVLKIKENLNKEFPGTEIDTNEVEFEDVDSLSSNVIVGCKVKFVLPKEESAYLDKIADTPEYEKEYDRIWNIAKAGIKEINDDWYYDADWTDGKDGIKIFATCYVCWDGETESCEWKR